MHRHKTFKKSLLFSQSHYICFVLVNDLFVTKIELKIKQSYTDYKKAWYRLCIIKINDDKLKENIIKVMFYFISCKIVPYDGSRYKNKIVSNPNLQPPLPHKPLQSGNRKFTVTNISKDVLNQPQLSPK